MTPRDVESKTFVQDAYIMSENKEKVQIWRVTQTKHPRDIFTGHQFDVPSVLHRSHLYAFLSKIATKLEDG